MARRKAPLSLTAGSGFHFADQVAARFALDLLSGMAPFGIEHGHVRQIDWEVRDSDHLLDDLSISMDSGQGDHTATISIKSDRQVTSAGFPEAFVRDAWEEWLHTVSTSFRRDRDLLVLTTGEIPNDVESAWKLLLREAVATDSERLVKRLAPPATPAGGAHSSELQRSLFASLHCPADLQSHGPVS